jgi:hypothetical protein
MGDIITLKNNVGSFNVNVELRRIVFDFEDEIIKLNTNKLLKGLTVEGKTIGVYSPATEAFTRGETGPGFPKIAFQPYNLLDTGRLFKSISANYDDGAYIRIFAVGQHIFEVYETIKKHGFINNPDEVLFGLDIKNTKFVNFRLLKPQLQNNFRRATGL